MEKNNAHKKEKTNLNRYSSWKKVLVTSIHFNPLRAPVMFDFKNSKTSYELIKNDNNNSLDLLVT